jgi:hypothetical protein
MFSGGTRLPAENEFIALVSVNDTDATAPPSGFLGIHDAPPSVL